MIQSIPVFINPTATTRTHYRYLYSAFEALHEIPHLLELLRDLRRGAVHVVRQLLLLSIRQRRVALAQVAVDRVAHGLEVGPVGQVVALAQRSELLPHKHLQVLEEGHLFLGARGGEGVDAARDGADQQHLLALRLEGALRNSSSRLPCTVRGTKSEY